VSLTITDDGTGFDPAAADGGFGLPGMAERAELAGGHLDVRSAPGRGTTVEARVPTLRRAPG
jgi:signal transduction histidine kinase